jgi:MerR family transcriptional regulator, thiopeptide resistance regulator
LLSVGGRKVGEVAQAAGITVRTLHHYESIGLLIPKDRTTTGHRLYSDEEVERLYRITQLRRLGFSLGEVRRALDEHELGLSDVMRSQLGALDARIETATRLRSRIAAALSQSHPGTDVLLKLMEETAMLDTSPQRRIGILVYKDLEAAYEYLLRVFGLGPGELDRTPDGIAVHGEIEAGDGVLWLHAESAEFGLASPATAGVATAMVAVMVDDVDAHYQRALAHGAEIVGAPVDQPYGYREYTAKDHEGGLWSFMKPIGDAGAAS